MALHFSDVSPENLEKFFINMIVSDLSMPHTKQRLSPITFCEFMARNQIQLLNPFDLYDQANKVWRKFSHDNPNIFDAPLRKDIDLDQSEIEHSGWNIVIDYLRRLIEVSIIQLPYYQMHYIAHVCHNFVQATNSLEGMKQTAYRNTWNEILSPIMYECIIPARYAWLPIENYADIRFGTDLAHTLRNAKQFIDSHSAVSMNYKAYDEFRVQHIRQDCENTINKVYKSKLKTQDVWRPALDEFFMRNQLRESDAEMCEMWEQFRSNGMQIVGLFDKIDKFQKDYTAGKYNEDPDSVIDTLLDIRPRAELNIDLTNVDFAADNDEKGENKHERKSKRTKK